MNDLDIIKARIIFVMPSLPKGEKKVANYLIEHLDDISALNLSSISGAAGASQATIIRLCKRLGYNGFLDLRKAAKSFEYGSECAEELIYSEMDDIREIMQDVIALNEKIMANAYALITDEYEKTIDALLDAKIITMIGNGDAIMPCEFMGIKLMKIGIPCRVINDQDFQLLSAATMGPGDVLIGVSHTGRSKSVVEAVKTAQERGAITIAITGSAKSPLLKHCSIIIQTGAIDDKTGGDIISRRIAEQTIMETLYLKIMSRMEKSVKEKKMEGVKSLNEIYKISDSDLESAE